MISIKEYSPALSVVVLLSVFSIASILRAQTVGSDDPQPALTRLVQRFTQAQHDFDLPTLKSLTAENYVEVSPVGEVDPRDKMLGFYAPDKKSEAPPLTLSDLTVRVFGESAAVIAKISYDIPGHPMEIRGTFMAHHEASGWKLVSIQYTGIRPPRTK